MPTLFIRVKALRGVKSASMGRLPAIPTDAESKMATIHKDTGETGLQSF